jgi:hypothetical protein
MSDYIISLIDNIVNLFQPYTDYVYLSIDTFPTQYPQSNLQFTYPTRMRSIAKIPIPNECNEFLIPLMPDIIDPHSTIYTLHDYFLSFSNYTITTKQHIEVVLAHKFLMPHTRQETIQPYTHIHRTVRSALI